MSKANHPMKRREFLGKCAVGAAGMAVAGLFKCEAAAPAKQPNIIFFMADDLGYGHLGCYGQQKILTPNIDRLAAEGMRFTQFYAGYTVCAPSRSVLMTGLHHGHTPVRSNSGSASLLEGETTVAQVLQEAGYATGGFGKWGLGLKDMPGRPSKKGFDEFYGYYHQVHAHFYYPYWIMYNDEKLLLPGNENGKREQYVPDVLHEKTLEFIRSSAQAGRPFFCYVPTIIPHVELAVPEDSEAPYRGKFPKVTVNDSRIGYIGSDHGYATFAGMISRVDRHVGDIMALLKELKIDGNTIVIFTSDNGPMPQRKDWGKLYDFFNGAGPLRDGKGSLYEGGIRVPFIARWPGKIPPGTTSDHLGAFHDIMPTFAEIAGATSPETDGISIMPTLLGKGEQPTHEYLFWTDAVRMDKWKAVRDRDSGEWQLFDLSKDIGETNDVAGAYPEVVARIREIAAEAYVEPRPIFGSKRVGIADFVQGEHITMENAR